MAREGDKGRGCRSRDKIIKTTLLHSLASRVGGEKVIIIPAVSAGDGWVLQETTKREEK